MFKTNKLNLFVIFNCFITIFSVDHSKFKTCEQNGFCRRNRNFEAGDLIWSIDPDTIQISGDQLGVETLIKNNHNNAILKLTLFSLLESNSILRLHINELNSERARFDASGALIDVISKNKLNLVEQNNDYFKVAFGPNEKFSAKINLKPFKIDIYSGNDLVIKSNDKNRFNFEHFRHPPTNETILNEEKNKGMWEENFSGYTDSKSFGPMSIGLDFTFVNFNHIYGIPEHADSFNLRDTVGHSDPYRLFNVDVFEYELDSPMALYGAIPFLFAHSAQRTVGLLWLNPSDTYVDIQTIENSKSTHWISETGILDVFFLLGETYKDVMQQNADLTGKSFLPPYYSIGHHQSRWNYLTETEVLLVDQNFENYNIPVDAIWLDIEYTDDRSKRYFTWSKDFANPQNLTSTLNSKGKRLICIIDPHIKNEHSYVVFKEAKENNFFVKTKDGNNFEGWCWPGNSMWIDFTNSDAQKWWARKFDPEYFPGFPGGIVDIWNDMNEPAIFNSPEFTLPKDVRHVNSFENRDVHNMYGYLMTKSTFDGLITYRPNLRPFILTRSFFVGSQKYCAAWTGDIMSKWSHLKTTIPMLLSLGSSGYSFTGADVTGFFYNPESLSLVVRWYQAGAFQSFYRAHAHIETKKREPWTFSDEIRELIGDAIRLRFYYLPYIYTLFYENTQNGMPVMRPLLAHFEKDEKSFNIENAHLFGHAILVHPVTEDNVDSINVYLPGENKIWLQVQEKKIFEGNQVYNIPVNLSSIPYFQLGGTIIPKRERLKRSAVLALNDPLVLDIFLDKQHYAEGNLYIDDGTTFNFKNGQFLKTEFTFKNNELIHKIKEGKLLSTVKVEKIRFYNYLSKPTKIIAFEGDKKIDLAFRYNNHELIIRKPDLLIHSHWRIIFN